MHERELMGRVWFACLTAEPEVEVALFEIPPVPRRPDAPDWRVRAEAASVDGAREPLT